METQKFEARAQTYTLAPELAQGVPADIRTLVLLLYPYSPWNAPVDAFYPASNRAYHALEHIGMIPLPFVRLKPLCNRLPMLTQGRNTLHYHAAFGSRFCMALCGLREKADCSDTTTTEPPENLCTGCDRCIKACPTGAITQDGFLREKCLRNFMLSGKPTPEDMRDSMGGKLLGCDICQRVCPMNAGVQNVHAPEDYLAMFALDKLLAAQTPMDDIAQVVGRNYALANRWLSQAALCAGNSGNAEYLPALEALRQHPSETVREHAHWAKNKLCCIDS